MAHFKSVFTIACLSLVGPASATPFLTTQVQCVIEGLSPTDEVVGSEFAFKTLTSGLAQTRTAAYADYGNLYLSGWKINPVNTNTPSATYSAGSAAFGGDNIKIFVPTNVVPSGATLDVVMSLSLVGENNPFLPSNFAKVWLNNDLQQFNSVGSFSVSTLDSFGVGRFKNMTGQSGSGVSIAGSVQCQTQSSTGGYGLRYAVGITSIKYGGNELQNVTISSAGNYDWRPKNQYPLTFVLGDYVGSAVTEDKFTVDLKVYDSQDNLIQQITKPVIFGASDDKKIGKLPVSMHGLTGAIQVIAEVTSANNDGVTTWLKRRVVISNPNDAATFNFVNGDCVDDGVVDIADYTVLSGAFSTQPGDPDWDQRADLNRDGIVDIADYNSLSSNFSASDDTL